MVIIHTATTGHIRTTATTVGRRIIGTMGTDTIATTVIATIISIKLM
jgi:hypothetical protein